MILFVRAVLLALVLVTTEGLHHRSRKASFKGRLSPGLARIKEAMKSKLADLRQLTSGTLKPTEPTEPPMPVTTVSPTPPLATHEPSTPATVTPERTTPGPGEPEDLLQDRQSWFVRLVQWFRSKLSL